MKIHPVADLLPNMSAEEYEALKADIADYGQRDPIVTIDGAILDGRHRYRACEELGITPNFRIYQGDTSITALVHYTLSTNVQRRHLTSSQKAVVALEVEKLLAEEAKVGRPPLDESKEISQKIDQFPDANEQKSAARAAAITGTNRQYVSDAKKIAAETPDLLESIRDGSLTIPTAKQIAQLPETQRATVVEKVKAGQTFQEAVGTAAPNGRNYKNSSESNEWYTPSAILELARSLLGQFDLDPASSEAANKLVQATNYFSRDNDGLKQDWYGRVWLNPPYGNEVEAFVAKMKTEYEAGRVGEALLLVAARTDTAWFRSLREYPRCFVWGRIKFIQGDTGDIVDPAGFPSMVVYFGNNLAQFATIFQTIGDIYALWRDDDVRLQETTGGRRAF